MSSPARVPSQHQVVADTVDLWCMLCVARFEQGRRAPGRDELAALEVSGWTPSTGDLRTLRTWQGGLEWTEWALPLLHQQLLETHPSWGAEAVVHLAGLLAQREVRLRVLLSSEWRADLSRTTAQIVTEGFPSVDVLEWCWSRAGS